MVGYKRAPRSGGARECGSIFAREHSKLRADGPHANGLKVGELFLSPAAIVSRGGGRLDPSVSLRLLSSAPDTIRSALLLIY